MKRGRRKSGFTLIEMMISSMLFAVLAIGVTTYILYMTRFQHAQQFRKTVSDIMIEIIRTVHDDRAWANTVADATNTTLACLKDTADATDTANTGCTTAFDNSNEAGEEGAQTILLRNSHKDMGTAGKDTLFYDPYDKLGLVTDPNLPGWSLNGTECSTFRDPAVNNTCPLWAGIYWEPVCDTTKGCRYPLIRVKALMKYRPYTTEKRYSFSDEKHALIMYRNTLSTANFFTVVLEDRRANGIDRGVCTAGGWTNLATFSNKTDGGTIVPAGFPGTSPQFIAGTYDCEFFSTGYNVDSFQARLQAGGTTHILGTTEYSGQRFPSNVQSWGYGVFELGATTALQLQMRCGTSRSTWDLGRPVAFGGSEVYAKLRCVKIR